jgi:cyclophilin family peptidyl-prolyl cis-trans isomerase
MKVAIKALITFFTAVLMLIHTETQAQTVVQWYTNMGDFRVQLREDLVPMTAQNFIDLTNAEFYDGLIFHRVIANFMIQDGDPTGTGSGGPGYTFDDEFHPDLRHDQPGILSMANAGPNTNGSQYFITVVPTAWLDDVHAVFGKVMDGMEVVYAISEVETNANDRPLVDVVIDSIRVVTGEPEIEMTSPVSYNTWNYELEREITWNSSFIGDVKIELSTDNGQTWEVITESYSAHYRKFDWELPSIVSEECFIRISDVAHPDVMSMNEEPFTICSLDLEYPDGFNILMNDIAVPITWSEEFVDDVLTIEYQMEENGDWIVIEEGVPSSDLTYTWYPEVATNWCKIAISVTNYYDIHDVSEFKFFVYGLDLLAPQGGEDLEGNTVYQIEWEAEIMPKVKIEFSTDNGSTWELIENNVNFDESPYDWSVPNIDAADCFIKLSVPSDPSLFKTNTTSFSIHKAVGVEAINQMEFVLQPNPVSDLLSIQLNNEQIVSQASEVFIYSAAGKLVQKLQFNGLNEESIRVDVSSLNDGLYFIEVKSAENSFTQKFVKSSK